MSNSKSLFCLNFQCSSVVIVVTSVSNSSNDVRRSKERGIVVLRLCSRESNAFFMRLGNCVLKKDD